MKLFSGKLKRFLDTFTRSAGLLFTFSTAFQFLFYCMVAVFFSRGVGGMGVLMFTELRKHSILPGAIFLKAMVCVLVSRCISFQLPRHTHFLFRVDIGIHRTVVRCQMVKLGCVKSFRNRQKRYDCHQYWKHDAVFQPPTVTTRGLRRMLKKAKLKTA